MKILLLTEFFPTSDRGEITGGVEARCFFVSKYLRQKGHKVLVLARPTSGSIWQPPIWQSVPERIIFTAKTVLRSLSMDFDIVEGTNFSNHLVAALVGFIKQKLVVCWYPDVFLGRWQKIAGSVGFLGEIAERTLFILPFINYIAISESTKSKLIKSGVNRSKIKVIYCGVDRDEISKIPKGIKKYDVCAVSRFLPYKRLDWLIKAAGKFKVVIVGQGPEQDKLQKMSDSNVEFPGHIPEHRKVLEIMASSRIFCHPSVVEGFGIVVIETAALGVPYVAADIPVIREVTHDGLGGLLFKKDDINDLKRKIITLLSDKKLYTQKVKEAKTLAKNYGWKEIASQTEQIYENLLSQ